jgi:polar amino acid transport system permease protein
MPSTGNLYWPALWDAALRTLEFTVFSLLGALTLGLVLALMKGSRTRLVRTPAVIYTELFKNSPLLVVIFVIYFGLPNIGLVLSPLIAGCLSMTLFFSSYLSEIFIVLPQAIRLSLAATGNMVVDILKSTSLLSTITATELLSAAQTITSQNFEPMKTYLIIGAIYFVMCYPLSRLVVRYEAALKSGKHFSLRRRRISRHLQRLSAQLPAEYGA